MAATRRIWTASVTAATCLAGAAAAVAQTGASVDIGVSTVRYDGFLPSGAASLTPTLTWEQPGATARGTYLHFESGRRSLQGVVAASFFTHPGLTSRPWRGELSFSAGGSSYADFASFWHATGEARVHFVAEGRGAWLGGAGGRTSYGRAPRPVAIASFGAWVRQARTTVAASVTRSIIGDTAYTDLASNLHATRGSFELSGSLGARMSSRGAGRGVYGETSATVTLGPQTALFVSGGRYPTDPVGGSVAGRYATIGVRLRTAPPRSPIRDPQPRSRASANADGGGGAGSAARLEVRPATGGMVRIVVYAAAAAMVELAGDFTDWDPITLHRTAEGSWATEVRIPSGLHRVNVRGDGGEWTAPAGTTRVADEFGGEVGILSVP